MNLRIPFMNRRNAPGAASNPPAAAPSPAAQQRDAMLDLAQRHVNGNAALTDADRQLISTLISGAERLTDAEQRSGNPPAAQPAAGVRIEPVNNPAPAQQAPPASNRRTRLDGLEQQVAALQSELRSALDRIPGRRVSNPLPCDDPSNTRGHSYSVLRVLRSYLPHQDPLDGLELETSQEIARRNNRSPQGVFIPWSRLMPTNWENRAATSAGVASTIQTEVLEDELAELLRAATIYGQLGGRILTGLTGPMSIPRQATGAVASFVAEDAQGSEQGYTTTGVPLTPRTITAWNRFTRSSLIQTAGSVERMVREDLRAAMGVGVDRAVFTADGVNPNPEGILADTDIPTVLIGANGGPLTYQILTDLQRDIGNDNAVIGELGIATTHNVRSKLKNTVKFANTASPIWETAGGREEIDGIRALASTQIPNNLTKGTSAGVCSALILGVWTECILALWNEIDVIADPYSESRKGNVIITMFQECDYVTRQPKALRKIVDITTT